MRTSGQLARRKKVLLVVLVPLLVLVGGVATGGQWPGAENVQR